MMYLSAPLSGLLVVNWQSWWLSAAVCCVSIAVSYILYKVKKSKVIHEANVLRQEITECTEKLNHAKESERRTKESIEATNRSKTELLSKLSHEIRTPMNGVIGMASLLSETPLTEEQKEYATTIIESSERLMTTLNNMLVTDVINYSETPDRTVFDEKDYDLRYNIETVLDSFAAKAAQTGVELEYIIDKETPEMLVGDELRLRQVLMNLVENAMRFTTDGDVMISVSTLRLLEGNQADLSFEISDTGSGLPAADVELLSKDISDINTQKEGAALPLIICKKLIDLMGGRLDVETRKGVNSGTITRFKIRTRISLQPHRITSRLDAARGKQILLVDDNAASRHAFKKQLEQWNVSHTVCSSAKEALEMVKANPRFDMILTDMQMPRMNGIELANEIKHIIPNASFILLNTFSNEQYKNHPGLFAAVIAKPVKQQLLYNCLSHELSKTEVVTAKPAPAVLSDVSHQYPLRILVAEDNKTNQDVALKFLGKLGYRADLAQNGQEALELIGDGNYDLIFMDVQMPVKDGLETTRLIRLCLSTQPVIIAMTANAIQGDRQTCLNAGMDDYISKPFRMEELAKMIMKWGAQIKIK